MARQAAASPRMDFTTTIGLCAAVLTTVSNYPQLKKCWDTGSAGDLSLKAFSILFIGVALWIAYGVSKNDWIIISANIVSITLLAGILFFKIRETF
jgi:MtN3 and saliva related transmembrane protein